MKLFLHPRSTDDTTEGGIPRVINAQQKYLPEMGWKLVDKAAEADVIASHIAIPKELLRLYPEKVFVEHCHGLYWAEYEWAEWCHKANAQIMESIRVCDAVTAPSRWVADIIERHTLRPTTVIPHGVELEEWQPVPEADRGTYVLWDKARVDAICDPTPLNVLAQRLPEVEFVTTFGNREQNVTVTGTVPYPQAKTLMQGAGIYLATTRETFGISVIQALACGVPIVGFGWAGQAEMGINEAVAGVLVPVGDYDALTSAVRHVLANLQSYRDNAAALGQQWAWRPFIQQYADLYERLALDRKLRKKLPRTSVIVTSYNLGKYLPDALDSVRHQKDQDWECVIVDDASTDDSVTIAQGYVDADPRFRLVRNEKNLYLSGARNVGIEASRGRYILPLDADDMLAENAIGILSDALDKDRSTHVAYGNVMFVNEQKNPENYGREPGHSGWPAPFDFGVQMCATDGNKGRNSLPYSSMFRREAWELTGGYRRRCKTAEDADFWCRVSSYGFRPRMVTTADTLVYRNREGSMSRSQGAVRWARWFGWSGEQNLWRAPAGAVMDVQLLIPSLAPPVFSILIPVGPGHEELVMDAIDSVEAQRFQRWEVVVAWDSPKERPNFPTWVKLVYPSDSVDTISTATMRPEMPGAVNYVPAGVAKARNLARSKSIGRYLIPLDADDYLQPDALSMFAEMAQKFPDTILYSDFWEDPKSKNELTVYSAPDWDPRRLTRGMLGAVTQCIPAKVWDAVGGFDPSFPIWEDWMFQLATAEQGVCSLRIPLPLWTYRKHTGYRRNPQYADKEKNEAAVRSSRFGKYWEGAELMACRKCGGGGRAPLAVEERSMNAGAEGMTLMSYTGTNEAPVVFRGPSKTQYSFSRGQMLYVFDKDVDHLMHLRDFQVVTTVPELTEPLVQSFNPAAS